MPNREHWERDLDAELRGHLELLIQAKVQAGLSPDEARRQALAEMGGLDQVKEAVRATRRSARLETMWQDVRYGARRLRRDAGFTLIAAGTLALGIGATTAMFTVVRGVLLRQLDLPDPMGVLAISESNGDRGLRRPSASAQSLDAWQRESASFASFASYVPHNVDLTGRGDPEEVLAIDLSREFASLTGARVVLGRAFGADDFLGVGPDVMMLDETYWRVRFGADSGVVGRAVTVDGAPRAVVGILRTGWPRGGGVYLPMPDAYIQAPVPGRRVLVVGRLRPGVPEGAARAELETIAKRAHAEDPRPATQWAVDATPLLDTVVGGVRRTLYVLLGAVGCVLLIVCVNVAGLLFARAGGRAHEMAIRSALGASRARMVGQLFVEGSLLTGLGSVLGLVIARWGVGGLRRFGPESLPRLQEIAVDARILWFSIALTGAVGLLVALTPAWRAARWQQQSPLQSGARSMGHSRGSRSMLVVTELAFATMLLVGAGLVTRSLLNQMDTTIGFDPSRMLVLDLDLPDRQGAPDLASFAGAVEDRLRALPSVTAVGTARAVPFESFAPTREFQIAGRPPAPPGSAPVAYYTSATPGYLTALGARLIRGRFLRDGDDRTDAPRVVVINETMARRYWGEEDPVGQRLEMPDRVSTEVVGVVADIRQRELQEPVTPAMWVPWAQAPSPSMLIVVRTTTPDPADLVRAASQAVWAVDPTLPVETRTMEEMYAGTMGTARFNSWLLIGFAATALLLAAMGVYGLVAYSVALRRREIGLRVALGAQRGQVERMLIAQGVRLAALGLGLGVAGALPLTHLMGNVLYGVAPSDGVSLLWATALLAAAALLASWLPARSAARMLPLEALRLAD